MFASRKSLVPVQNVIDVYQTMQKLIMKIHIIVVEFESPNTWTKSLRILSQLKKVVNFIQNLLKQKRPTDDTYSQIDGVLFRLVEYFQIPGLVALCVNGGCRADFQRHVREVQKLVLTLKLKIG
jgi:hypothetical protein